MLYAGFDCSTQSLSVVVIEARKRTVVFRDSMEFAEPFVGSSDSSIVHASPRMWADALDTMLERVARNTNARALQGISGSAQQHGSVYCGSTPDVLTRKTSPIWMDCSTARECAEIEEALGGAAAVAQLTGSRAFPRFTGPQIRKFARQEPRAYTATRRIHLVSSYLASLLIGGHAPIDHADGSGMNLMDIRTRQWSGAAVDATAPRLLERLPSLVPSSHVAGPLASHWQQRSGLPPAQVVTWSGDNPCSLVGTGLLEEGQLAISLGTSDTIFGPMRDPRVSTDGTGHVFASPLGEYMGITVFRNGSLARERIRDRFGLTWRGFSDALRATDPGNGGAIMLPWFEPEITPNVVAPWMQPYWLDDGPPARHVRALVEGQMMAVARHSAWMDITPRTIYATGGASANQEILQVMADVFDANVYRFDSSDSAALGAALRAMQAVTRLQWKDVVEGFVKPVPESIVRPLPANVDIYRTLKTRYGELEATVLRQLTAE